MDAGTAMRMTRLLLCREIAPASRGRVLWEKVRRSLGRATSTDVPVRVGEVTVWLGADSFDVDWYVLNEVFVMDDYARGAFGGANVIDLGAHKGYFAAMALARGAESVTSYEPEPTNFARLERSAQTSDRWSARPLAVTASGGAVELAIDMPWSHSVVAGRHEHAQTVTVESMALEDVLSDGENLHATTLVKIDIEGAECEAVWSTPPTAWADVNEVLIEVHEWACSPGTIEEGLGRAGLVAADREAANGDAVLRFTRTLGAA